MLDEIFKGLYKMYNDGIFQFKPHTKCIRGINEVYIDTTGVSKEILEQLKDIATKKGYKVEIDTCYHWFTIYEKEEDISKYFE